MDEKKYASITAKKETQDKLWHLRHLTRRSMTNLLEEAVEDLNTKITNELKEKGNK